MDEFILELKDIEKSFDNTVVLKGINLSIKKGEFVTLLGSSGSGKTTTLRIIAGLETLDKGQIILEGVDVTNVEPNKRNLNTVFQNYALFPHMNVEANVGYSLKIRKTNKVLIKEKVTEVLETVQLSGYEERYPSELSGGQKQRVAIARALVNNPKVLLLDEPLGALDLQLRRQMQNELKKLQKQLNITFIYITHDQEEALNMSDRIAVMNEGVFEQIGTPTEIYDEPKTSYVAKFVGTANIIKGEIYKIENKTVYFKNESGTGSVFYKCDNLNVGDKITVAVRSEHIFINADNKKDHDCMTGIIKEKSFAGGMLRILVELSNGLEIISSRHGVDSNLSTNENVIICWNSGECRIVDIAGCDSNEE